MYALNTVYADFRQHMIHRAHATLHTEKHDALCANQYIKQRYARRIKQYCESTKECSLSMRRGAT